jgi:4-hydroxyphenylacetate 3-monooxygenase
MFLSAGNVTHTPAYGNLIALGVLTAVQSRNPSQHHVAEAMAYRQLIARTADFSPIAVAPRSLISECARTRATASR